MIKKNNIAGPRVAAGRKTGIAHPLHAGRNPHQHNFTVLKHLRNGYKMLYLKKGENRAEHRFLMERLLKRKLRRNELVHHIDGNRLNNDIKNLIVVTNKQHWKLHPKMNWHWRKHSKETKEKIRASIISWHKKRMERTQNKGATR
jgi:hypothetical protein